MSKKKKNVRGRDAVALSVAGDTGSTPAELIVSRGQTEALISHNDYAAQLRVLQIELVKLQRHFIGCGDRILVLLEGRDAAGKDGSIKRVVEHLSPRETRTSLLTASAVDGTSSVSPSTSPWLGSWFCSIVVGTTVPASSM